MSSQHQTPRTTCAKAFQSLQQLPKRLTHPLRSTDIAQLTRREIAPRPLPPLRSQTHAQPANHRIVTRFALLQHHEPQQDLRARDSNADDDEEDDDPCDDRHLGVGDAVAEDLSELEEDAAALVEDFDARRDFHVFPESDVQGVQSGFRVPEEVGNVEDVGC